MGTTTSLYTTPDEIFYELLEVGSLFCHAYLISSKRNPSTPIFLFSDAIGEFASDFARSLCETTGLIDP